MKSINGFSKYSLIILLLTISTFLFSQKKPETDGPYVFYRNNGIIVKSIVPSPDSVTLSEQVYKNKSEIIITCFADETGDKFSFRLNKTNTKQKCEYKLPKKMFVISDIEGNFKGFKQILSGAGVINDKLKWIYGKGHLVFNGDLFDRGVSPAECLWLLYKLEKEAELAGGKVHFILGNHEIMNMNNNPKYVHKNILKNIPLLNEDYKNLFNEETELGRWLRTKNVIEKIGNYLFVHGGFSSQLDSLNISIEMINEIARSSIGKDKNLLNSACEKIITSSKIGPYWYRGLAEKTMKPEDLNKVLEKYRVEKIIIGHSIFDNMQYLYDGKVVAIDLEHQLNSDKGFMLGLLIERGKIFVINDKGIKSGLK